MKNLEQLKTASNYHFSGTKIDDLGATEYTLATICMDASSSVSSFRDELNKTLQTILEACQKSPRSDNLMLRLVSFDTTLTEIHGFRLLNSISPDEYSDAINPQGMTALFDAAHTAVDATNDYAKMLADQHFLTNAIVFVVTDGDDNSSKATAKSVGKIISKAKKDEYLESLTVVLVGVDSGNSTLMDYLQEFQKDAGITQFIDMGAATPGKLAKLAQFVSQSISSTSSALGSGSPSKLLSF